MLDLGAMVSVSAPVSRPQLSICTCLGSETVAHQLNQILEGDRYVLTHTTHQAAFLQFVEGKKHWIDCLIFEDMPELYGIIRHLHREATLLPVIILRSGASLDSANAFNPSSSQMDAQSGLDAVYHTAEVYLSLAEMAQVPQHIDQAITRFLQLSPACRLAHQDPADPAIQPDLQQSLTEQQQRLSEKLKERLGYLGVYYNRDSTLFLRNLSPAAREQLLNELKADYRDIVLSYFNADTSINAKIDEFVAKVFFADMSISKVLEIHMELIDTFSKQLRLEGRSEDILQDYRLTLIDTIAHLCELYRRSIPRES